jgi:hypothetical protein
MSTATGRTFHVPYKDGTLNVSEELFADLDSSKKAYELANDSVPLADIMRLANIGRDMRMEMPGTERYSGAEKEAATSVDAYLQARRDVGAFAKDYVLIEPNRPTIAGTRRPEGDYVAVKLFHNAKGAERNGKFVLIDEGEVADLWLPRNNGTIAVPGRNGDYNRFGLPEETVKNKAKAIEMYKEAFSDAHGGRGITDEEAADMLSNFYIRNEGWAAVRLWSDGDSGSRCVSLDGRPLVGSWGDGRFVASRSQKDM